MKLVAMMVVHNEADRYLRLCLESLLTFCDEIRVLNDGSTDKTAQILDDYGAVSLHMPVSTFYNHEGQARQALLEWTMLSQPTHVLAIDADEFVADGQALRAAIEHGAVTGVWKLTMTEVWKADEQSLLIRTDGDWSPRPIGIAFHVPPDHFTNRQSRRHWRINDKALACGRVPLLTQMSANRTISDPVTQIFHFGWACEADREARYERYVTHDGGQFHASKHLQSIMWPDAQVGLAREPWPESLDRAELLARVNR